MNTRPRKFILNLLVALYFLSTQATVAVLVAQWYSTQADQRVDARCGPAREIGNLQWSPRTHLPLHSQDSDHLLALPTADHPFSSHDSFLRIGPPSFVPSCRLVYTTCCTNKAPPRS